MKDTLGCLRHVVLFKFREDTPESEIKIIEDAFCALPDKIPVVLDFEWGANVSPEGKADGYTHCFLLTFAGAAERDTYLPHPAHEAFKQLLKPHLEKSLVIDYFSKQ